jgi:DNA-binding transcriptional regulator YiaG
MNDAALLEALTRARLRRRLPPPRIRRLVRQRAGLSPNDVARVLGLSRSAVTHWELGRRAPRTPNAEAYATLLDKLASEVVTAR